MKVMIGGFERVQQINISEAEDTSMRNPLLAPVNASAIEMAPTSGCEEHWLPKLRHAGGPIASAFPDHGEV